MLTYILLHTLASITVVILMAISTCFIAEKQKEKAISCLQDKGIKVHADYSTIVPYATELDDEKFKSTAKYNAIRGEVRVYKDIVEDKNLSDKQVTDEVEHELYHKAMDESTQTSKERKEVNKAQKAYAIYSVLDNINLDILELESKVYDVNDKHRKHEIDSGEADKQVSRLYDKISERKEHYHEFYEAKKDKIPKGMTKDKVDKLLFDFLPKRRMGVKNIGESFTQILNLYNGGYDSEKNMNEGTNYEDYLGDKECTDVFGEKVFGSEVYDSPEQKETYNAITDLYRALQTGGIDKKEIMQIILPFSQYIQDKSEIDYILSSEDSFADFLTLVNETEDKREVAKRWVRRKAAKYASKMFEEI